MVCLVPLVKICTWYLGSENEELIRQLREGLPTRHRPLSKHPFSISTTGGYIGRALRVHDSRQGVEGRGVVDNHEEHEQGTVRIEVGGQRTRSVAAFLVVEGKRSTRAATHVAIYVYFLILNNGSTST